MSGQRLSASVEPARNEAAERLRDVTGERLYSEWWRQMWVAGVNQPLWAHVPDAEKDAWNATAAAERRATVERIRKAAEPIADRSYLQRLRLTDLDAILDKEAAR